MLQQNTGRLRLVEPTLTSLHQETSEIVVDALAELHRLDSLHDPEELYRERREQAARLRERFSALLGEQVRKDLSLSDIENFRSLLFNILAFAASIRS